GGHGPCQGDPLKDDATMMDVIAAILGRLVNVALFVVFSILALLFLRANTDLHMGLVAVLSIVIGVAGTVLVRVLLNALRSLGEPLRSWPRFGAAGPPVSLWPTPTGTHRCPGQRDRGIGASVRLAQPRVRRRCVTRCGRAASSPRRSTLFCS